MDNLIPRLEKLELNLKKILYRMNQLQEENLKLQSDNTSLRKKLDKADEELAKIGELNTTIKNVVNKEELSSKIDDYVIEIDACINYLKKLSSGG